MKCGDIIVVKNVLDPLGYLIGAFNKGWNHVAIAYNDTQIVDCRAKGIYLSYLTIYSNKKRYRVKILDTNLNCNQRVKIKKHLNAFDCMNLRYKYLSWVKSLFMVAFKMTKALNSYHRTTCSGFVAYVFSLLNIYFHPTKSVFEILPKDIINSLEERNNEIRN